jgi:CBS domain-containing protein
MLVRDLMHQGLITCSSDATLGEAAALLVENRVHGVIVTNREGAPLGVLSDTDLLAAEWVASDVESLRAVRAMTAAELMSSPLVTIPAEAEASEAAVRMRREHLSRLVVTDREAPVGVISVSDLVASLASGPIEPCTVGEVMSRGIVTCLPDTPVAAAARAMTARRSRSLVVVDRIGRPVGVLTGYDLIGLYEPEAHAETAADLMHPPLTIHPGASLREAADRMIKHEVHRLVVIDEGKTGMPVGIVSTSDIVLEMAQPGSSWRGQ